MLMLTFPLLPSPLPAPPHSPPEGKLSPHTVRWTSADPAALVVGGAAVKAAVWVEEREAEEARRRLEMGLCSTEIVRECRR